MHLRNILLSLVLLGIFALRAQGAVAGPLAAGGSKVFLTMPEALELAFPECEIEKRTIYLSKEERETIEKLAKVELLGGVFRPYVARKEGKLVGYAYFDLHRVRTLRETLMIVVDPQAKVRRIEVLAFGEPEEYLPREGWYGQFIGRGLDAELGLKTGIRGVAGATLTSRATTDAVRRVLAVHAWDEGRLSTLVAKK